MFGDVWKMVLKDPKGCEMKLLSFCLSLLRGGVGEGKAGRVVTIVGGETEGEN